MTGTRNLLWLDRRKCILLAHADTLFPVFVPDVRKPDFTPLGPFVASAIARALRDQGLSLDALGRVDPDAVHVARTEGRRTLGFMNEMALTCRYSVEEADGLDGVDVGELNGALRLGLLNYDGYRTPLDLVAERATTSRVQTIGERIVGERSEALRILAEHDPDAEPTSP